MNIEFEARVVKSGELEILVMENKAIAYDSRQPSTLYSTFIRVLKNSEIGGRALNATKLSRRLGFSDKPVEAGSEADKRLKKALAMTSHYSLWVSTVLDPLFGIARDLGTLVGVPEEELRANGLARQSIEAALNYSNAPGMVGVARISFEKQDHIVPCYTYRKWMQQYLPNHLRLPLVRRSPAAAPT